MDGTNFDLIAERVIARRDFLNGVVAFGATAFVAGAGIPNPALAIAKTAWLDFEPVAANTLDTVTLPKGFQWQIVVSWGDPLWSRGAPFDHRTRGTGVSQELAFGDNNDGMALFARGEKSILAVNNEYVNLPIIHGNRASRRPETADDVRKTKAAQGVSIFEMQKTGAAWSVVQDSPLNRRITADTPIEITGPARTHDLLKTAADPDGVLALGTWSNCGNGATPWGTYLTCEENFNLNFSSSDPHLTFE